MSEKSALRFEEAMQSPVEPPTSSSPHKARRRARLYKAACFYFSIVMANTMHKYAVANSRDAQRNRWNELIAPVNARLSPWILLLSVREIRTLRSTERPELILYRHLYQDQVSHRSWTRPGSSSLPFSRTTSTPGSTTSGTSKTTHISYQSWW